MTNDYIMRVLWFSNSPVSADKLKKVGFMGGSWIIALETKIKEIQDIELGIVCQERVKKTEIHLIENVQYFICPVTSGFIKRKIKWGGNYKTNDSQALAYYRSVIEEFRPDVIQVFGTENNYGLITTITKIPTIIHIQGFLNMWNRKYFSGVPLYEYISLKNLFYFIKGVSDYNYYLFHKMLEKREKVIYANAAYFLGRTDFDRRIVKTYAPHAKYFHGQEMIRNDFFLKFWDKKKTDLLAISTVILGAPYKGLDIVFESAGLLEKNGINFQWNIIGTSPDDGIVKLVKKKYKRQFSKKVIFHGGLRAPAIIELLLDSDMYVHPSYIENSPNSVCEAMLLGIPTIVASSGGCSSIMVHNKEGLLVNTGDPFDLTGAILDLHENPKYAKELGINARKRALIRHNPDNIVKDLLNTYINIIAENDKKRTWDASSCLGS